MLPTQKQRGRDDDRSPFKDAFHVSCMGEEDEDKIYNIFLYGSIDEAEQFIPAVEALQYADERDLVVVHLSTPGGSVDATDAFLAALSSTSAQVVFKASGGVCSAGTMILVWAADNGCPIEYSEGFYAMVHTGSFGYGGKMSDFKSAVRFLLSKDEAETWGLYKGFLTDEEIEHVLYGREYWFTAHEVQVRLRRRQEMFREEELKEEVVE